MSPQTLVVNQPTVAPREKSLPGTFGVRKAGTFPAKFEKLQTFLLDSGTTSQLHNVEMEGQEKQTHGESSALEQFGTNPLTEIRCYIGCYCWIHSKIYVSNLSQSTLANHLSNLQQCFRSLFWIHLDNPETSHGVISIRTIRNDDELSKTSYDPTEMSSDKNRFDSLINMISRYCQDPGIVSTLYL